ncbi:EexN family lipoprotein [Bartonella tribocorum]|uniref:EexN family lipoprotein n=1 Tax=Bartonella tribocorum TaxID=85701 RepID=UPI0002DEEF62|nr:EexN family lipoprotein [Bartonella tribocorum]CDO49256.1 hypothetical protein BM1374166_01593 [Bartonella tribocorum]
MKKVIIPALLLCTGLAVAGCEKTYSVEEFKKDKELRLEWQKKCYLGGASMHKSKNCENAVIAERQLLFGG